MAEKRYESLKGEQHLLRRKKTMDFLLQKGYEPELITSVLKGFGKEE